MERYRIGQETSLYYLTYSVVDWLPVFVSGSSCQIVTDSLAYCHREKSLRINAFVIMPTHLHLIVLDEAGDAAPLAQSLADLRKFLGRKLSDHCVQHGPPCFLETMREEAEADRLRRFWQPTCHPEAIVSERFWRQKLDYVHDNPCRKGLVRRPEHWRFSSAAWHFSDGAEGVDVPLSAIDW